MDQQARFRGCLLGLAVGDAVGTAVEFAAPGSFPPVEDMVGGGPFGLKRGQWTDDTSMALCLAESLIRQQRFDPVDQLSTFVRWRRHGHLSSTGTCFDIGNTTSEALRRFEQTQAPYCGSTDPRTAGNGSLMRLAPVPLFYSRCPDAAIERAADHSRTTHAAAVAVDACRYLAALIVGGLNGASHEELLSPRYSPIVGYWTRHPLTPVIDHIATGSFRVRQPPEIRGAGYAADTLEAALWAFYHSVSFRDGCLRVVNLGDDADTTGAVYGQIAGAFYGEAGIPQEWLRDLALRDTIAGFADRLLELSLTVR